MMSADVSLRFLIGAARLVSIYFIVRLMDNLASAVVMYQMQMVSAPAEVQAQMPSVWVIFLPISLMWLVIIALCWFGAPWFCRLALGKGDKMGSVNGEGEAGPQPIQVSMNETMIFLTGGVFLVWGVIRLVEDGPKFMAANDPRLGVPLDPYTKFRLYSSILLAGGGGLMMARFPSIYRWIERRKREGTLMSAPVDVGVEKGEGT